MSTTQDPGNGTHETTDAQAAELWPSGLREGYAEIGDVRLHYVEAGEGPLIVLLHGFPEFWYAWRQQIEPLVAAGFLGVGHEKRGDKLLSLPGGASPPYIRMPADGHHGRLAQPQRRHSPMVGSTTGGALTLA